jgi:hypothetical protein
MGTLMIKVAKTGDGIKTKEHLEDAEEAFEGLKTRL